MAKVSELTAEQERTALMFEVAVRGILGLDIKNKKQVLDKSPELKAFLKYECKNESMGFVGVIVSALLAGPVIISYINGTTPLHVAAIGTVAAISLSIFACRSVSNDNVITEARKRIKNGQPLPKFNL